jgi:hypothetical protein
MFEILRLFCSLYSCFESVTHKNNSAFYQTIVISQHNFSVHVSVACISLFRHISRTK